MKILKAIRNAAVAVRLLAAAATVGVSGSGATAEEATPETIDVMFIVDTSADNDWDSWELDEILDYQIDTVNAAFAKAGSDIIVKRIDLQSDLSLDARSMSATKVLEKSLKNIKYKKMRNQSKADVVAVVIGDRGYGNYRQSHDDCGAAGLGRPSSETAKENAFVVISTANNCRPNNSLIHQLGHILGVRHSRYDVLKSGNKKLATNPDAFAFGYTDVKNRLSDVMALDDQCKIAGVKCARHLFYSDPKLLIDGKVPLGKPVSSGRGADAARAVRKWAPVVAAYR
jgi:hypothetical protein